MSRKLEVNEVAAHVKDGVFFPDHALSEMERSLFNHFEDLLRNRNFKYISVPSLIKKETIERQDVISWEKIFKINDEYALSGSAEQGILELYTHKRVDEPTFLYAKNQCFRAENEYDGLKRLKEFQKIEQFIFTNLKNWEEHFDLILENATSFLDEYKIQYRVVDVTDRDPGYHILKKDIEVYTKTYGWMETHSCTYFGTEQSKRFDIHGDCIHTMSNTGIASPRILVPFLEK